MSIIDSTSPQWIESQYQLYKTDPQQVPEEWRSFFQGFELGMENRDSLAPDHKPAAVQSLIRRYRDIGHIYACVDPLTPCSLEHPLLQISEFGLEESDLNRTFATDNFILPQATLKEIVDILKQTYCSSLGMEFMHIPIPEERKWLQEKAEEARNRSALSRDKKLATMKMLLKASKFESFLHRKFVGQKRFSLEGAESVIPLLDHLIETAASMSMKHVVIGMAHRGRLNVLANIFEKPLENMFAEFADNERYKIVGEGDVKYHKGYSTDRCFTSGCIHVSLASNPSHLEAVNPVVEGKCRARQDRMDNGEYNAMPLLIHGDAAFAGQGVVAETLNLSQLAGYKTGGTLHVVINNQIGFTTLPVDARSTCYPTDIAKMLMSPIFHVHGDDPEALIQAATMAIEFRQKFRKDVVIEVICYRRYGHNEGDEPFFTQPLMYEKIKNHPLTADIYKNQLLFEGFQEAELQKIADDIDASLEEALNREICPLHEIFLKQWSHIDREFSFKRVETGVAEATLQGLSETLTSIPADFTPHRKIATLLKKRRTVVADREQAIDWGTAEALAFASLVNEGTSIRLSGQDSRRGTFNHRHATLYDIKTGREYTALADIARSAGCRFDAFNSMLSEAAVLGFDYGYSVETPDDLTIWEAQFGDFANGAQVIIDQFIASSLAKWDRPTGLAMFLPHGYEGQGPEHSSARIERYLQLCADNNMQVVNPSTPAQFFHVLRRQVRSAYRRPLIVATPKALLRHPACVSSLADLSSGHFREILPDDLASTDCRRVLLCSGKIYYELLNQRSEGGHKDVAIVRIEQLYPLHTELLQEILAPYRNDVEYYWVQEEPGNGGGWDHLRPLLRELIGKEPVYVGRKRSASTAVGSHRIHKIEQQQILEKAFATL